MEQWLPISGFEGLYEVSNLGRVKSLARMSAPSSSDGKQKIVRERILAHGNRREYLCVTLFKNAERSVKSVHHLVAEAFIGDRPVLMSACHNDGDSHNNRWDNLRYDTHTGNIADKLIHGTHARGEKNPSAKLTDKQVMEIRAIGRSRTQQEIADIYGVHQCTISDILLGYRMLAPESINV